MSKPDLILIALEDPAILRLMDSALHAVKYETAIAKDTQALSRILQEASPVMVLIGEKFGGHDSLKISTELLERFPTLPILIYTQKPTADLLSRPKALHMAGFTRRMFFPRSRSITLSWMLLKTDSRRMRSASEI